MHASDMVYNKHQFPPWLTRFGCDYQYTDDPMITIIHVIGFPPPTGLSVIKIYAAGELPMKDMIDI
jgi:hypothetical protein